MRVIVIGATGALGKAVVGLLETHHTVVKVGKSRGDFQLDVTKPSEIEAFFKKVGSFDALVSTVGKVHFAPLEEMNLEKYTVGLHDKLLGQVNLVLIGQKFIHPQGSFTLTSGILGHTPVRTASSAMMVNKALEGFVKAAAFEMQGRFRLNVVSPTLIEESMPARGGLFEGFVPIPGRKAAEAYLQSIEGSETGKVYEVFR